MKKVLFICLMIWFCNITSAQNTISGKVADQSGNPMSGANVFLPEQNKGTVTGQTGDYKIENLPNGKIKMQFYFIGFAAEMKTVVLQDSSIVLNIIMNNTPIELPGIVVTGGYVSAQHDNAVKIDVIEIRDIALSGTPNFMEALSTVPGVDMIAKGQGVSKPVIRGLSMNDILVMNNGVRIENYQFSENHPLGVDDNNIDKVEIIKGPASLLYGSDAIGGVFNFIKERPAPIGEILGDYRTQLHSNTSGFNNSLGIKGASEHVFAGFRAGNKTHADYKQGGGDFVPNSRFNEWSFNLNSGYTGKPGTFKIFYDYFKQDLGMTVPPVKALISEQGRKNEIWYQDLEHQLLSSQNMLYLGKFQWEINAAYQNALRKLQTTLDVPFIEMNLNTITYESKMHLPSDEKTEYIIGLQGMSQNNRNRNNRASQFLPNADINNLGFLGLSQYRFFNKLMLQGGLRYDRYITETFALGTEGAGDYHAPVAKDFTRLTGSVGATCNLIEQLLLRVNVAKAYRAPNLSELTSNGMHGARYEIGSENLNPENACETDISMHYHGEYLSLDLAGFYNQIDDYIYIAPTSDTTAAGAGIYRFSQTNANLLGGEAGLHVHPQSMSWLHLQATYSMVTGKQQNGNYLPFIPAQKIRYEAMAEKEKIGLFLHPNIRISALSALRQHHPSPFEAPTDRYTLVNAGLSADIKISNQCLNISLSVNNIFDTKYFDHLSTLKPMNYYNQGRNICLNLKIPFGITKNE